MLLQCVDDALSGEADMCTSATQVSSQIRDHTAVGRLGQAQEIPGGGLPATCSAGPLSDGPAIGGRSPVFDRSDHRLPIFVHGIHVYGFSVGLRFV